MASPSKQQRKPVQPTKKPTQKKPTPKFQTKRSKTPWSNQYGSSKGKG